MKGKFVIRSRSYFKFTKQIGITKLAGFTSECLEANLVPPDAHHSSSYTSLLSSSPRLVCITQTFKSYKDDHPIWELCQHFWKSFSTPSILETIWSGPIEGQMPTAIDPPLGDVRSLQNETNQEAIASRLYMTISRIYEERSLNFKLAASPLPHLTMAKHCRHW